MFKRAKKEVSLCALPRVGLSVHSTGCPKGPALLDRHEDHVRVSGTSTTRRERDHAQCGRAFVRGVTLYGVVSLLVEVCVALSVGWALLSFPALMCVALGVLTSDFSLSAALQLAVGTNAVAQLQYRKVQRRLGLSLQSSRTFPVGLHHVGIVQSFFGPICWFAWSASRATKLASFVCQDKLSLFSAVLDRLKNSIDKELGAEWQGQ